MKRPRIGILSVVPSPYQRDLFSALVARDEFDISISYMEQTPPDSPWPAAPLAPYEKILPGFWIPLGSARCHFNRGFPNLENFDLIICNTLVSFTAQSLIRSIPPKKPWIFWGERLRRQLSAPRRAVQNWLSAPLARATAIVGVGSRASDDYRRRFARPLQFSIPYYCDLQPFVTARSPKKNPGPVTFLFCGQMISRKGIDLLLEAFARLCRNNLDVKLLLVGREAELPPLLAKLPSTTRAKIEFAGFQPPEKLPEWFSRADVFVLPSRYEGWGVVINQALGAALPIICTDAVGAGCDLVEEGINGARIPAGSLDSLSRKMEYLVNNPAALKSWSAASAEKSRDWIPAVGAAKWSEVIHAVLPQK